ncbi:MAG TPA: ABC transporter permease [Ilumatobacter sp.]
MLSALDEGIGNAGQARALGSTSPGALNRSTRSRSPTLLESTTLGALGGILGTNLGVIVVVAVSAAKQWTPVLDPWLPIAAPIAGAFVGLVAGLYPALKAASVEPITALRQAL